MCYDRGGILSFRASGVLEDVVDVTSVTTALLPLLLANFQGEVILERNFLLVDLFNQLSKVVAVLKIFKLGESSGYLLLLGAAPREVVG